MPNNNENSFIRKESDFFLRKWQRSETYIVSDVVTKPSKSMYHVHNVTFIFGLFDTNIYCDNSLDEVFVREFIKGVFKDLINDEKGKNRKGNRKQKSGLR